MKVGVVGLGAMGGRLASRLHAGGLLAALWNRTPEKAQDLALRLGLPAPHAEPADLWADCEAVVISVSDDAALAAVTHALCAREAPRLVIDTSTVASATSVACAAQVSAAGGRFLECPVSGGVEGAAHGTLVGFAAGSETALEEAEEVLAALCATVVWLGGPGRGQLAKAVNQVVVAGINQATSEGLAFARALGLPDQAIREALSAGMAGSRFLERRAADMQAGRFAPGFRVALHAKDLRLAQAAAATLGAQLPLVEMTLIHYERLCRMGHGDDDISALIHGKDALFGRTTPLKNPRDGA